VSSNPIALNIGSPNINAVRHVDGTKFTNIAAAVADLGSGGGMVVTPPGYTETITSSITLGNGTNGVILVLGANTNLTIDIRDVGKSAFVVSNKSGIIGYGPQGTAALTLAGTAQVASVITTAIVTGGGQSSIVLEKITITISGVGTPTVANAGIDLTGINGLVICRDVFVAHIGAIGINIATNATAVAGPMMLDNCWVNGVSATGSRPLVIKVGSHSLLTVQIHGGGYMYPQAGLACIEVNGNTLPNAVEGISIQTYIEDATGAGTIGIKLVDCNAVSIFNTAMNLQGVSPVGIDISQSAAGLTKAIAIFSTQIRGSNASGGVTAVNNHITGEVTGQGDLYVPQYVYTQDGTGTASFPPSISGNLNTVVRNFGDSPMSFTLDSGLSSMQVAQIACRDRGTGEWNFGKGSDNSWFVYDSLNGKTRIDLSQSVSVPTTGALRLLNVDKIAWRNAANSGDLTLGYDGSNNLALSTNTNVGNGAVANVTTPTKGSGGGPATPQSVNRFAEVNINGAVYWIPLMT
jgi:hypothetical protein